MNAKDISAVMEIEIESHLEPWSRESFLEELNRPHSRVFTARIVEESAETPNEQSIVGYICFWIVADEIQVLNLAVHGPHRKCGIGRALLEHALELAGERGVRIAVLEVRHGNLAARRLYESVGFRSVGERPGYYGRVKESAVLMELDMDNRRNRAPDALLRAQDSNH